MLTNKKILLTGGAGFIGTKLVARLVDQNEITIYDNLSRNSLQSTDLAENRNVKVISADILDYEKLRKAVKGQQVIIHLAGVAGIDTVLRSPVKTFRVNLLGTANICEAARESGTCERLIDFSTSEVFGQVAFRSFETQPTTIGAVGEPRWNYAVSKLAGEHLVHAYYREFGLPTISVRPFNIYGPGQVGEGALQKFVIAALKNVPLTIFGDGSQIRSWCYVDDFVNGLLLCLENPAAIGQVFNIGNPQASVTILNLAETILSLTETKSYIEFVSRPGADVELRIPNIEKAKQILGFIPTINLSEGILRTIEWYRKILIHSK